MGAPYFERVKRETPTRLWVNNPTVEEVALALREGAIACTTNPAYAGGLLKRQPELVLGLVDKCIGVSADDDIVVTEIQDRLVSRLLPWFRDQYDRSEGREGFVSIQGNPERDGSGSEILAEAERQQRLGANVISKIPATEPGFAAVEALVDAGRPVIVTEVFSVSQLMYAADLYVRVTDRTGVRPPYFVAAITGIFADRLRVVAGERSLDARAPAIDWTGVAFARECSRIVAEDRLPVTLLSGGARGQQDFTGLVGRPDHITVNYSTVAEITGLDPAVTSTVSEPVPSEILEELKGTFEEFLTAMTPAALEPHEFESFPPVRHFRDTFLAGWHSVREAVGRARTGVAVS